MKEMVFTFAFTFVLFLALFTLLSLVGCTTTKGPPKKLSDVSHGDVIPLIVEGYTECTMRVENIIKIIDIGTELIYLPQAEFCGLVTCGHNSVMACLKESSFYEVEPVWEFR